MAKNVIKAWTDMNRTLNFTNAEIEINKVLKPRPFSINTKIMDSQKRPFTAVEPPKKISETSRFNKVVPFSTKPDIEQRNRLFSIKPVKRIQTAKERSENKALKNIKYLNQKFQCLPINFFVEIYHTKVAFMAVS
jgi:hypothetical protein